MAFSESVSEMDGAALEAFGEPVSYEPVSGAAPVSITAIYYDGYQETPGNDITFGGTGPHFAVHRDDVTDPKKGDIFERADGSRFEVVEPIIDAHTLAVMRCRKTRN